MMRRTNRGVKAYALLILTTVVGLALMLSASASAAQGTLEVCKAGTGGAAGSTFSFTLTNVATGATQPVSVVGGSCSSPITADKGKWQVQEDLSSGLWNVSAVSVVPSSEFVSSNLNTGTITVKVASGEESQVSFSNTQASATIKVCKFSSSPVIQGSSFTFNVGGTIVSAVAGTNKAHAGCSGTVTFQPGTNLTVSESVPAQEQVTGITGSSNLTINSTTGGNANVTLGSGANVIYYDNEVVGPAQTGYIAVCKNAGDQFTTGIFQFTIVDHTGFTDVENVYVGQCTGAIQVAAGNVTVTETAVAGTHVSSIFTIPAGALGSSNTFNRTATVVVPVSQTTNGEVDVFFVNNQG